MKQITFLPDRLIPVLVLVLAFMRFAGSGPLAADDPAHRGSPEKSRMLRTSELERTDATFTDTLPGPAKPKTSTTDTASSATTAGPRVRPASAIANIARWEEGEKLLERIDVPPAPVLAPEEALDSFQLAPGYRAELFAAEPMVQKPIFFEFDPDGRLWAVEYQGYMRDLEGSRENAPICRVVVLEDTDEDGRADKSTVFLDGLVMPRSFAFVKGGILLQEPPRMWFCQDTDGDLVADKRTEVGRMGIVGNPQHTANGLRYGIDNWLHCADSNKRYRWRDGKLEEQSTVKRGQFGLTFDEAGRFYSCYENRPLSGDHIPAEYLLRNPHFFKHYQGGGIRRSLAGVNVNLADDKAKEVFPVRVTPAVTLGAMELRDDGRLRTYTISSGVCCYDGHQFPEDARGNFFVPESGGHLVGRLQMSDGLAPRASRFYSVERELIASTDERFRPVNARVGPDGALYIADMYHGIIEHRIFLVPWLTKQIRDRKLDHGNDHGRIWRIVAEDHPIDRKPPRLTSASTGELVETLSHPNGWHRLTAQRLLIERGKGIDELRAVARDETAKLLGQLHALWTLEGLGSLDLETRLAKMRADDENVRAAAVRLSEEDPPAFRAMTRLIDDPSDTVRLQVALSLGSFSDPESSVLLSELLERESHPLFRSAALTGLGYRELEFLQSYEGDDAQLVEWLAACVLIQANPERVTQLFAFFTPDSERSPAFRDAVLAALAKSPWENSLRLPAEPTELVAWQETAAETQPELVARVMEKFTWPGAPERQMIAADAPALAPEQQKLVAEGGKLYAAVCTACHQPHGRGAAGLAPPLAASDWVSGSPERLARVVLQGLYGPIQVNGEDWNLHMPGLGAAFDDRKLAALLSYVRRAWGNNSAPVAPEFIAEVRAATKGRTLPWRVDELNKIEQQPANTEVVRFPGENGELQLPASAATVYGHTLKYRESLDVLAPWRRAEDVAEWTAELETAGRYEVHVLLAADDASAGDRFVLETDGSRVQGTVVSTGDYETFREVSAGIIDLKVGANRLILRSEGPLKKELADVRSVRLVPLAGDSNVQSGDVSNESPK